MRGHIGETPTNAQSVQKGNETGQSHPAHAVKLRQVEFLAQAKIGSEVFDGRRIYQVSRDLAAPACYFDYKIKLFGHLVPFRSDHTGLWRCDRRSAHQKRYGFFEFIPKTVARRGKDLPPRGASGGTVFIRFERNRNDHRCEATVRIAADAVARLLGEKWVVVVEPSQNYRASLRQFLTNLRIRNVKLVSTADEARKLSLQKSVGMFIVEWLTPGTNGLQFRRELLASVHAREVPFLLLSMENLEADVVLASEVRVDGYLLKPFSYEDFVAKMHELLIARAEPNPMEILLATAEKALLRKDFRLAGEFYAQALALKDNSARAAAGLARVELERGDLDAALAFVHKAQSSNKDFLESHRVELKIHQLRKSSADIIRTAKHLHDKSPENPKYSMILAKTWLESGDLSTSEQFFRLTLAASPRLAAAYKGLGDVYMRKADFQRSKRYYLKALDLDGEDISILNGLGTTSVRQGSFKEGIKYYLMALKLDARNPKVKFNLGHAYEKLGEFDQANYYFSAALQDDSGFDKARTALERISQKKAC